MHYVYIIYSPTLDRFYIGESTDPETRLEHHNTGDQRFTKRADDWELVFKKAIECRSNALILEKKLKASKSRKSLIRWIKGEDNMIPQHTWGDYTW